MLKAWEENLGRITLGNKVLKNFNIQWRIQKKKKKFIPYSEKEHVRRTKALTSC